MSAMDSEHAWHVPGLSLNEKAVLAFITCKANKREGNTMWWSQKQIAELIGCSRETVKRALKTLEQRELISREAKHYPSAGGGLYRGSDVLTVHVDRFLTAAADVVPDAPGGGVTQTPGGVTQTPPPGLTDPTLGSDRPRGGVTQTQQNPGTNPGIEPGKKTLESNPLQRHQDDKQHRDGTTDQLPGQTDVLTAISSQHQAHDDEPAPMTLEDERKRQMDALAALMGDRAA